ncbi:MAG: PilN domain-containing protein [Proteobacteria bacterium]|nr:PilN domain-containing protein [Pseudomonadota bacterium]
MIKGINLIPAEIQANWKRRKVRAVFYTAAAIYILLLGALYYNIHSGVVAKRIKLANLEERKLSIELQGAQYQSLTATIAGINNNERDLKKRLDLASGLTRDRVLWSTVLKRMSNDLPNGIWLKSITTSDAPSKAGAGAGDKQVRLLGSGITPGSVSDLIFTLENSGYFSNVQLAYTQKKELEAGTVYDFEVITRLKRGVEGIYGW